VDTVQRVSVRHLANFYGDRSNHLRRCGDFGATVCKTVRPMLSDRCPVCPDLSCLSCLSCLSVCDVGAL